MTSSEPMDVDNPDASWNRNPVDRKTAEAATHYLVTWYRLDDGRILTHEELADEVTEEAKGIPEESWVGGEFDCNDYIIECCLVGIYEQLAVHASIVTEYADGDRRWTLDQL